MTTFFISLLSFLVGLGLVSWQLVRKHTQLKQKQGLGLRLLSDLRQILAYVQQHRGLTTAHLKGDQSVVNSIQQIGRVIATTRQRVEKNSKWVSNDSGWQGLFSHWQRLAKHYQQNTVQNNLQQHNKLIQNILYLIEEMAEEHGLLRIKNDYAFSLEFIWKDLLETTEYMGQARALGMGIVATGTCDSVERIRLNYLKGKITQHALALEEFLTLAKDEHTSINALVQCMEQTLPNAPSSISTLEYFKLATAAMDTFYHKFDDVIYRLNALKGGEKNQLGAA